MASLDDTRYRQQQEEFVSNHGGTTPQEIIFLLLPNVLSVFLTISILDLMGKSLNRNLRVVLEFILTVVPSILCCTILSEHLFHVCAIMLLLSLITLLLISFKKSTSGKRISTLNHKNLSFLTNFRAWTNITTVICILAVDFQIFPRKFAKTEVYGYSLMDTGVGLFIIANALVAPEARGISVDEKINLFQGMIKSLKSCIPLLILGFGRFFAIEYLGYQRHITEYGVHWNFFITLAFVKLFTSMISKTISSRYSLLSGLWILAMYEYGLNAKGLKKWILSEGSRDDFISANREGLVSIPGYVGLYLIAVSIGKLIHSTYQNLSANSKQNSQFLEIKLFKFEIRVAYNQPMILCIKLSLIASHFCAVMLVCDSFLSVSRRLANAGYCAWIVTLAASLLTLLLLVEILIDVFVRSKIENENQKTRKVYAKERNLPKAKAHFDNEENFSENLEIFEAVNYNGLGFFLLANILTGTVNMSVKTLYVDDMFALKILVSYLAVSIVSVLVCYRHKVQIRL
ncbi:uncharacterized protein At4g17910 [Belonocnema kinseyi]|uniref:uncharacterized protein At4g17910 n=1 Tax=Belonocnema kinseyi TaxID=2817044 RepID=UPI00143DC42D|nr:uncharacterized protein At4g17910 [Belonocnema kinseyi]XP_033209823.1 uncharacterized protein At4g17910 [Belonocnema kinseyi]